VNTPATDDRHCPVCGQANECRLAKGCLYKGPCWCESMALAPAVARHLTGMQLAPTCLCGRCLSAVARHTAVGESAETAVEHARAEALESTPTADADFYLDELGRTVFTAAYHLKRGYCCENGCRHCPYPSTIPAP
jgi:hypothetical protein